MKDGQQKPQDLIVLLKGHKTYIQTHNFPDPDAIASAYGLQYFLQQFGIDAILCYDGSIDKLSTKRMLTVFSMEILHADLLADMQESDYIVTVDGQKYNTNFTDLPGDEVACVDHHPQVRDCGYHYKDIRMAGACSSIVVSYYREMGIAIPPLVA